MENGNRKLENEIVDRRLESLPRWRRKDGQLCRDLTFADFSQAFGFMAQVALAAETMGHHPDWSNVWNKVSIALSTHDAGGITDKDFELAAKIDRIAP
jgi:4a-hydroxytetrahydrobiopterin dehydratase